MTVEQASRWDNFLWPRWLPERARLPLVAQITGAVALTALIVAPWWSSIPHPVPLESTPIQPMVAVAHAPAVTSSKPTIGLDADTATSVSTAARPAHLNLDVRHSFASLDLSVTVDGKPALNTKLDGSGKRFKMFGKRTERNFTQSLELPPGVRIVRVRLQSAADKFDQTRVERFELGSAAVAAIRVAVDKSGMSLVANHPPTPPKTIAPPAPIQAAVPASPAAAASAAATTPVKVLAPNPSVPTAAETQAASTAVIELVQSLRSMLIAIAGFVASAATGFVVQEFLRRRRGLLFQEPPPIVEEGFQGEERRRRRRAGF
jgi:hypothetical protein